MKNKEQKKFEKEVNELIKPHIAALSIPITQILLGRKRGYLTSKKEKELKRYTKKLIDLF